MAMYDNHTFSDQCAPAAFFLAGALIWATEKNHRSRLQGDLRRASPFSF